MKTFNLYGQRFKITLLPAGNIRSFKKSLAYQHGIDTHGNYVNLCGRDSISNNVYVLEKSRVIEYPEYSNEEIRILVYFIQASLDYIKNPKLTEILVRGLRDREIFSYFYNDILIKRGKWKERLGYLANNPEKLDTLSSFPYPARFDRHKYSIYQLLKDLKEYKAEICINEDALDYEKLTTSERSVRKSEDTIFGKVCDVVGNKTKANLSLMVKSGEDYSTLCFICDGKPHLTECLVKITNPYLRKKLYGARVVVGHIMFNDLLYIKIDRLPVISRRFLRVREEDIVSSLVNEKVQELGMKKVSIPESEKEKLNSSKNKVSTKDKFEYCELRTKLLGTRFDDLVKEDITTLDYKTRRKELKRAKRAKNDLVFRYLLGKPQKISGFFKGRKDFSAKLEIDDRTR